MVQISKYMLDITYTPGRASLSANESKNLKLFVSTPSLESKIIKFDSNSYKINEAWIEKAIDVDYFIFIFRQTKTRGYRLVLKVLAMKNIESNKVNVDISPPYIVCNENISMSSSGEYFYGEFTGELPNSVRCMMKPN